MMDSKYVTSYYSIYIYIYHVFKNCLQVFLICKDMNNYFEILCKDARSILKEESLTEREAWYWLVTKSVDGKLEYTIRDVASIWKWHKSKVERFLCKLKSNALIDTDIVSRRLVIKVADYKKYHRLSFQDNLNSDKNVSDIQNQDINVTSQPQDNSRVARIIKTKSGQSQDNKRDNNEDKIKTKTRQVQANVSRDKEEVYETKIRQEQDIIETKTECLKEKKQKKNLSFKEKNIPYRDIKKESFQHSLLSIDQVDSSHAEEVGSKLSLPSTEIQRELEKFKSYWLASYRTKPRDGIAAFRNWLKKSIEFRGERKNYEQFSKNKTSQSGFERFLAGGARAVAEIERSGLDR